MSEWDKNRHVPVEELEGRDAFVRENAVALLKQRDERITYQKRELAQVNASRRNAEKERDALRHYVEVLRALLTDPVGGGRLDYACRYCGGDDGRFGSEKEVFHHPTCPWVAALRGEDIP